MKRNTLESRIINKNEKQNNFSVLTINEMISIKGGGKDTPPEPPIAI